MQGVDALEAYFAGYLPQLVLAAAVPVAILVWVVPLDLVAAVVFAVTIPLLIVFMILVGKGAQPERARAGSALALLSGHFLDVVRGLETLRAYRREAAQAETIERVGERYRAETMGTLRVAFLSALVLELCAMIGTALVAATIGIQLDGGHLALQAGLTVLLLAPELYGAAARRRPAVPREHRRAWRRPSASSRCSTSRRRSRPRARALRRVPDPALEPLRFEAVVVRLPGRRDAGPRRPGPRARARRDDGAGRPQRRRQEHASPRSRCGWPTRPRAASAAAASTCASSIPSAGARAIAWVPQRTRLFAGTIAENIALADPGAARARILERGARRPASTSCSRGSPTASTPSSATAAAGSRPARRSASGWRARSCATRSLVVLDEPTAHLDADTAAAVGGAIERLAAGRTTLLIAHDARCRRAPTASSRSSTAAPATLASHGGGGMSGASASLLAAARAGASERRRLGLAVLLGFGAVASAGGLLVTSGYLISRAAQRPDILTLSVAIVGVRAFAIARALLRYGERLSLARRRAAPARARARAASSAASRRSCPATSAARAAAICSRGSSATSTRCRISTCARSRRRSSRRW